MLLRRDDAGHAFAVEHHDPGDRPVGPCAIRGAGHDAAEGVQVAPAVAVMQQRSRQARDVHRIVCRGVLEARGIRHHDGRNCRPVVRAGQQFDDVLPAAVRIEAERERDAGEGAAGAGG